MAEPTIIRTPAGDPYEPKGVPRQQAPEGQSQLDQFANRLRQLGATEDEVQLVVTTWDDLDPADSTDPDAWTPARRDELAAAPDHVLVQHIEAARAEYEHDTTTEDEAAAAAENKAARRAKEGAAENISESVAYLREWVGDDLHRARAVLALETAPDGENRKTLVEPLTAMLAAAGEATSGPTAAATAPTGTVTLPNTAQAGPGRPGPAGGTPGAQPAGR